LLGLVWGDDSSLQDLETGRELLPGGDFEIQVRTNLVAPADRLHPVFDFRNWDRAMDLAMNQYHFSSFKVNFPGLGGGTFHAIDAPQVLGFREQDPEYSVLLESYGRQLDEHLRQRGWNDRAYFYWFDEPSPDQYPFAMNGFAKLRKYCPSVGRMLTEQVEPGLVGGPNIWCPISNEYEHRSAEARRKAGEKFWWYVCTGPKAPYAGLFIDHAAPEMRLWVWQTWQRGIEGLLVWEINYWTSGAAYPRGSGTQNPYEDPMSWMSGYSTAEGKRIPWGNGDGRFIYPPAAAASGQPNRPVLDGPVDSVRWEHLRDGIEDYEYFVLLRTALEKAGNSVSVAQADVYRSLLQVPAEISRSMKEFAPDGEALELHRLKLAEAIEKLGQAR
jgi:hypothetical protein